MPPETVYVGRPGKWGNPYYVEEYGMNLSIRNFQRRLCGMILIGEITTFQIRKELGGKNLACWCALDAPCHADTLLYLANSDDDISVMMRNICKGAYTEKEK